VSRLSFSLIIILFSTSNLWGQNSVNDKRLGAWTIFNFQYAFSTQWGVWGELQSRFQSPFFNLFYYEQKGGAWYNINKNFQVLIGTGYYATHDFENFSEGPTVREARFWEQLTINQYLSRVKFEHRYRIEQRWLNREFQDRFRYRLNLAIPINNEKFVPKTVFISGFNEIFLTSRKPHFLRNRVFLGVGYQFDTQVSILIGWLNQYNYNFNKPGAKNNISINLSVRLHDKDENPTRIPTPID
jgi:hypothetical protein